MLTINSNSFHFLWAPDSHKSHLLAGSFSRSLSFVVAQTKCHRCMRTVEFLILIETNIYIVKGSGELVNIFSLAYALTKYLVFSLITYVKFL